MAIPLILVMLMPNYFLGINIGTVNNLLVSVFAILYLAVKGRIPNSLHVVLIVSFYIVLQVLLFVSALIDTRAQTTNLSPAILRPIMLMALVLALIAYILPNIELISEKFQQFCEWLVWLSSGFVLMYVLVPTVSDLHTSLYLSADKFVLVKSAVGFFATTYFASFTYLLCFIVLYQNLIASPTLRGASSVALVSLLILFSFSKTALLCWSVLLFAMPFVHCSGASLKLSLLSLLCLASVVLFYFFYPALENLRVLVSAREMVEGAGGGSHSLSERMYQVNDSVAKSLSHWGMGVGMAEGILTESFVANFAYRYGLIGLFVYLQFWLLIAVWAKKSASQGFGAHKLLMTSFVWWQMCLPVVSLSNPVLEMGKGAVLNSLVIALVVASRVQLSRFKMETFRGIYALGR